MCRALWTVTDGHDIRDSSLIGDLCAGRSFLCVCRGSTLVDPVKITLGVAGALCLTTAILFWLPPPAAMSAVEVDVLAAAGVLNAELGSEARGSVLDRLKRGFSPVQGSTATVRFKGEGRWRAHLADPPLPRWLVGLGMLVGIETSSNLDNARWVAALSFAVALMLLWFLGLQHGGNRSIMQGVVAVVALLLMPGALDAARGVGAETVSCALMAWHLWAVRRAFQDQGGYLWVGVSWGCVLACHPIAIWLVIPLCIGYAAAYRPDTSASSSESAHIPLPSIRLGFIAQLVVALMLLVLLWPSLWHHTGRGLLAYLSDWAMMKAPGHVVGGAFYLQGTDRAPLAWTAFRQILAWTPLTVSVMWVLGVLLQLREGRDGWHYPWLVLCFLCVVAGLDGGLWGGRLSVQPLLWPSLAIGSTLGAMQFCRWLVGVHRISTKVAATAVMLTLFTQPLVLAARGQAPHFAQDVGSELRQPFPLGYMRHVTAADVNATMYIGADGLGWIYALNVLATHGEFALSWAGIESARWCVLVGEPRQQDRALRAERVRSMPLVATDATVGVVSRLYRRRE